MASTRTKAQPIGSSGWIQNERDQSAQFVDQEVEEFAYSVRNELEWLNEHMGDIFARNNVTLADVFKTPGKLRGKTPRTARKRDALGTRQPLTNIFAPNGPAPASAPKSAFLDRVHHFQIAEDAENQAPATRPLSRGKSPQRVGKPGNTDSGYHGMTEDEMEVDNRTETATDYSSQQSVVQKVPLRDNQGPAQRIPETVVEARDGDTSGDSFMSAKEDLTSRNASKEQLREQEEKADEIEVDQVAGNEDVDMVGRQEEAQPTPTADVEAAEQLEPDQDAESSTSDASSPEKPLQRKSSFTFTALPPRDTLGAKRSIGARNSQIDTAQARNSTLGRSFGAKSFGLGADEEDDYEQEKPEESKAHSKTSTQLLHERINMLGKTKEPRPSKSIAQTAINNQPAYPQLPAASESTSTAAPVDEDDDDDWIAPSKPEQPKPAALSPGRPPMHQKSISTTAIPSPRPNLDQDSRQQKAVSVSNPNFAYALGEIQSTTPAGSPPAKKHHDGPLSASKNKLYSVLKSAKSIFASSASASAAAKLEAHNTPTKSPRREASNESKTAAVLNMPGAMYSQQQFAEPPKTPTRSMISLVSKSPSRKTRSSSESDKKREKELKAQQKAAGELEKAREKERQKAAKQQEKEKAKAQQNQPTNTEKELPRPPTEESEQENGFEQSAPAPQKQQPKSLLPGGKLRAPGRLMKPTRTETAQPVRPAPVSIRVASQSQRLGSSQPASGLSKSQPDGNAQGRPTTASSTRPGSAQGSVRGSAAPGNARVKALEAAQRKKEADERRAKEKLEQKRELERKRAAKAEEDRRAEEEKKAAEQARIAEAKLAAQRQAEKQALEQRRKEEARQDAQRRQEEEKRAKAAQELAEAIKRERAQEAQKPPRGDVGGTLRQLAKHTVPEHNQSRPGPQMNQSKPAKRVWDPAEDEPPHQHPQPPQRPGMQRGPPSYQQHDAKRRRTNEEEPPMHQPPRSSVMAPPMRPSAMRKESTLQKFPHGYTHAPPPAPHNAHGHAPSMFKATVTAQHQLHHPGQKAGMANHPSQMVQVSNARIPFAENANGQAAQYYYHPQAGGSENLHPSQQSAGPNKYKTPARPAHAPKSAKSSPLYPNGDNIQLPDIATDSEDEDSEDEDDTGAFRAPSWVASPALRELLTQQQLVDPESVFGPIGELKMDEVFKGAKNQERLKRFRDRGSSAAWVESGDAVTSAEKRRDMEMRERVVREGGWRYEPSH